MANSKMTIEEARMRMNPVPAPEFWVGSWEKHQARLNDRSSSQLREIARSPGGRPIHAVFYGESEDSAQCANYNSACGGGNPECYRNKTERQRPVVLFVGPVHGHEVEGLTGIHNLMHIIDTGADLRGKKWQVLATLVARCRLILVPCGNPDGLYRFEPDSLVDSGIDDLLFWGQGTHADGRFWGYPGCKLQHPMSGRDVGFLGCYFNDQGINPMHDEFFDPMGTEALAIIRLARIEAPDMIPLMHSHEAPPLILPTNWMPLEVKERIDSWSEHFANCLAGAGYQSHAIIKTMPQVCGAPPLNLTEALHHASGAVSATYESPHGLIDRCRIDHDGILDTQLLFFQATLKEALAMRSAEQS